MRIVAEPVANHWLRAIVSMIAVSARSIACSVGRPRRVTTAHVVGSLRDDLDLSCARHRRRLHIVHRNEPNGNLPQTWCFPLLQEWPLCVKAGGSLIVAAHIFRQSKQRRSARQGDIAFDAGLSKAAAWDPADLD